MVDISHYPLKRTLCLLYVRQGFFFRRKQQNSVYVIVCMSSVYVRDYWVWRGDPGCCRRTTSPHDNCPVGTGSSSGTCREFCLFRSILCCISWGGLMKTC